MLLRGQAGVGKSTLAKHLGLAALAKGHTGRFTTLAAVLADLLRRESIPIERRLRRDTSCDLLIVDELGYVPCDSDAADLLFRIVSKRHESRAIVITTNLTYKQWGHGLRRRSVPRRARRPLRTALPRPRHRRRLVARQERPERRVADRRGGADHAENGRGLADLTQPVRSRPIPPAPVQRGLRAPAP